MTQEGLSMLWRRFVARIMESGLLILAVALGVGTTSAGLALLLNVQAMGDSILSSPAYREILVQTQSDASDMASPAVAKPAWERTVLTSADLGVAQNMDLVQEAYIANESELRFINAAAITRMKAMASQFQPPAAEAGSQGDPASPEDSTVAAGTLADAADQSPAVTAAPSADELAPANAKTSPQPGNRDWGGPGGMNLDLEALQSTPEVVSTSLERLKGYMVTPGFFRAWGIDTSSGSLFTDSDASGSGISAIVLGSEFADQLAKEAGLEKTSDLVGKKLLTFGSLKTIVGIARPSGRSEHDLAYYEPYYVWTGSENGPPPRGAFNTALRFSVASPSDLGTVATWLDEWFTKEWGEGRVAISNPRAEAQAIIARNQGIGSLILFLALAGLFIASVNVSNILMSRALRMRKQTGILMALGSARSAIITLFGTEALLVAGGGSLVGLALAIPLSMTMQQALAVSAGSLLFVLPGALGAFVLVLAFTLVPAWQNSRINPADAMRQA